MNARSALEWLIDRWQWPYAALFSAVLLTALLPLIDIWAGLVAMTLTAQLPMYLFHQFEEHHENCFCRYVNATIGNGLVVLSPGAAFVINSIGVWGVILAGIYAGVLVAPGFGAIAVDLGVVNGILHIAVAAVRREYNPGLWTSLALFVPLGGASVWVLGTVGHATAREQTAGLAIAILIHLAIVAHVASRRRALAHKLNL